mgnify:CR=1 FL=1
MTQVDVVHDRPHNTVVGVYKQEHLAQDKADRIREQGGFPDGQVEVLRKGLIG